MLSVEPVVMPFFRKKELMLQLCILTLCFFHNDICQDLIKPQFCASDKPCLLAVINIKFVSILCENRKYFYTECCFRDVYKHNVH